MIRSNGKHTPYATNAEYHSLIEKYILIPEKRNKYMELVGDLRYVADYTRSDLLFW